MRNLIYSSLLSFMLLFLFTMDAYASSSISISTTSSAIGYDLASIAIDDQLTVSSTETIDGLKVSITNGKSGDVLSVSSLPSGITQSYNASTFVLTITGSMDGATAQTILRNVGFTSTSVDTTTRDIQFILGSALAHTNGHFYKAISGTRTWQQAYSHASTQTLFGMTGYLATITSSSENQFIQSKLSTDSWIGASDDADYIFSPGTSNRIYATDALAEGNWYWVTGPEAGTRLSSYEQFWASGEPNDWNYGNPGEDYAQYYSGAANWNDLGDGNTQNAYVVEFSPASGQTINLTASRSISFSPRYAVTYNFNNGTSSQTQIVLAGTNTVVPSSPSKVGYTFTSWSSDGTNITSTQTITAQYSANTNTAYTVKHYLKNFSGTYTLFETENLTGTTDQNITVNLKSYSGYTYNASAIGTLRTSTILGNGTRVFSLYYDRNQVDINNSPVSSVPVATQSPQLGNQSTTAIQTSNLSNSVTIPSSELNDVSNLSIALYLEVDEEDVSTHPQMTSLQNTGYQLVQSYDMSIVKVITKIDATSTTSIIDNSAITSNIVIDIKVPDSILDPSVTNIAYIDDQGNITILSSSLITINNVPYRRFETDHFSEYALLTNYIAPQNTPPIITSNESIPATGIKYNQVYFVFLGLGLLIFTLMHKKNRV